MSLSERLYFPEILRGLFVTLKNFFSKKVTMEYPEKRWTLPEGYRGFPHLVMGDNGIEKCVACKLCERACPAECIYIEIGEYRDPNMRERVPSQFVIDMGRCIVCGFCAEACPVDAIRMSTEYEFTSYNREDLIFRKDTLLSDYKEIVKRFKARG